MGGLRPSTHPCIYGGAQPPTNAEGCEGAQPPSPTASMGANFSWGRNLLSFWLSNVKYSLVLGLRFSVPAPWFLSLGPWCSLVLVCWSLGPGPWSFVPGPWSLVLGPLPWSLVLGFGNSSLVSGPWTLALVHGSHVPAFCVTSAHHIRNRRKTSLGR